MQHDNTEGFFSTLFLGQAHARPKRKLRPALKNQKYNVARVWRNTRHDDAGIERLLRLLLVWLQYLTIGLYVRHVSGKLGAKYNWGLVYRKVWVEAYVLLKLCLPLFFLFGELTGECWVKWVTVYMATETVVYLTSLIFLSNEFAEPISSRRSLITLFINYLQVTLDYAVLYSHYSTGFTRNGLSSPIKAIYFSFVTSATVGYGDIAPTSDWSRFLVVTQIILFIVFVALFINYFAARLQGTEYHITNARKRIKPWMGRRPRETVKDAE